MQSGYVYTPYSSLESIIERNKENYYIALRKTQATLKNEPNYEPCLLFFLKSLQKQKIHLERKLEQEKDTLIFNLSDLSREIINIIKEKESLGISEITYLVKANKNTVKKHLASLVKDKLIMQHGRGKTTKYRIA